MSQKDKFFYLSWQGLHQASFELSQKILDKGLGFDRIVAITRGGLPIARIFSDFLALPVSLFTIKAYTGVDNKKKAKVIEGLMADIKDQTILLLDEVSDTGDTFKLALTYLKKFQPAKIITCAPYIKPATKYMPDYWHTNTDKWIIFPYEIRETIEELRQTMTAEQIKKLGLSKKQVEYFFGI